MSLKTILHTTDRHAKLLAENGICTLKDFFNNFPRTYEDRSQIKPLDQLVFDEKGKTATKGLITEKKYVPRGKGFYNISFIDEHHNKGQITIFGSGYLASKLSVNNRYIIVGKPTMKMGKIIFTHPDVAPATATDPTEGNEENQRPLASRIVPIYSELQGIKPGRFAQKIRENLNKVEEHFHEYLPTAFREKFKLIDVITTIKNLHYPENFQLLEQARFRLFFDRLLRIQLYSLKNRLEYQGTLETPALSETPHRNVIKPLLDQLSFSLTVAQKKVIVQILEDFYRNKPMLRLLQGDVGSGKTIVATVAMRYISQVRKAQSVLLAPLEVLAVQHYKTLAKYLLPLGIRIELLTGSLSQQKKKEIKDGLKSGKIDIVVGTHALLQEDVDFRDLKFVCIDEQHKFGVQQRAKFKRFNSPHILQMTATPIPRSMALAFFGEFDVSVIDELPAGRQPIETKVINEKEYVSLKARLLQKISQGQKVFVVTPLISESESDSMIDVKSAITEHAEISAFLSDIGPERIGLLHGKMRPSEKEQIMNEFKSGKISVLVSTTVIEVGVDIPEATVMIIKNAERFGLSQLHQLRGRIGRSNLKSYCFLETAKKSGDTYDRLKIMETTTDGFKLAELDMKNRGSGEILGTMQSGQSDIPLEILSNLKFLEQVQEGALRLLKRYPNLEELPELKNFMEEKIGDVLA